MNESSMLYKTSRALLIKNKNRYAFGEAVVVLDNPYYDGNRLVIGKYHQASVVDEAVELTDKEKLDKFEESSYEFLNALNYGLRNYDSHFNISGRQYGDIYIQENAHDNTSWSFSSSEDDYGLMQECAWNQYLYNKARIQSELKSYVKEASIITNESLDLADKIDKLRALNEDDKSTIGNIWDKFKNFLNKIWQKFTEFIARNLNTTKGYLEKYKEIILNRELTLDNIEADADYRVGVNRLGQYAIPEPNTNSLDKINNNKEGEDLNKEVQKMIMPDYNGSVDFKDYVKMYFKGSQNPANNTKFTFHTSDLKMSELYNYCYNYEKIQNTLNKNKTRLQNAGTVFQKRLDELQADQTSKTPDPYKKEENPNVKGNETPSNPPTGTESGETKDTSSTPTPPSMKSVDFTMKPIEKEEEAEIVKKKIDAAKKIIMGNNSLSEKKTAYNGIRGYLTNPINNIDTYRENAFITNKLNVVLEDISINGNKGSSGSGGSTNVTNASALGNTTSSEGNLRKIHGEFDKDRNAINSLSKEDVEKFKTKCNAYTNAGGIVFAGMCTAAETIFNDYFSIIKAHVQSYAGKEGDYVAAKSVENHGIEGEFDEKTVTELQDAIARYDNISDENVKKQEGARILNIATDAIKYKRNFNSIEELKGVLKQRREELNREAEVKAKQQGQGQGNT